MPIFKNNWSIARIVRRAGITLCVTMPLAAQSFTTIHSFNGLDGSSPVAALIQATDGNLYGTTTGGVLNGAFGTGTIFKITPDGSFSTLYSFCSLAACADGAQPYGALLQTTDGNFYGTTLYGGASNSGTVFKITPAGTFTTIHSFDLCLQGCGNGFGPRAGLIQAVNGKLYGTTGVGGPNGGGTIFEITPSGQVTTIHSFTPCAEGGCQSGAGPYGSLLQAPDGNFYGTTFIGGTSSNCAFGCGTVFKVTPHGVLTTLHNFDFTDGGYIESKLIQGGDGNFYGTANNGGANMSRCDSGCGTIFQLSPRGKLTTYSFDYSNGEYPVSAPIQASNGNFYGTTPSGGNGVLYKLTPGGALTPVYAFCNPPSACPDGYLPVASLVQATNGDLYGTASGGGVNGNYGTIFRLSIGLGPLVKTTPHFGVVGATVQILGTNLTGATAVSFNGTAAGFRVISPTEIVTKVPAGASSGVVRVTTPGGTLSSGGPFVVNP